MELYTHHKSMKNIVTQFGKWGYRVNRPLLFMLKLSAHLFVSKITTKNKQIAAANLVDSHYCSDPFKYISVLLMSLQTMLKLELPHINILSKFDLIEQFGELAFGEDFYTEVLNLDYLVDVLSEGPFGEKWVKLNKAICELVTEFDLVNFYPLCIEEKESVFRVIKAIDKANGYFYGDYELKEEYMLPSEQVTDETYPGILFLEANESFFSSKIFRPPYRRARDSRKI